MEVCSPLAVLGSTEGVLLSGDNSAMNALKTTSYLSEHFAEQVQKLQRKLAETEDALRQERDRADLYQKELQRLRSLTETELFSGSGVDTEPKSAKCYCSKDNRVTISRKEYDLLKLKEQALDAIKEGITIADCILPDMPIIYANEAFSCLTGYSVSFAVGRNCRFLQGEGTDEHTLEELRDAIRAGRSCVVQLVNYKRNGDNFVNYLSLTPIYDRNGQLTHYVGVQSDITELIVRKKSELAAKHAAVQAAAATEAKSQFLARMSHEIRTPLNGMIAVGELLAETSLSPAQWDLVNTIRCSGETLLTLITDILDFSKIEANKMVLNYAEFRLQTVIEAAMEIAGLKAAQKRLQVAYHISDSVPTKIVGDAQRLQQVLLNVLNNAVKFTEQGQVLLEVWCDEQTGVVSEVAYPQRNSRQGACEIKFSVVDTGVGVAEKDQGRLFQSFSQVDASPTRQHGGSGLGLAISKKLCEAMGGTMCAESRGIGFGTKFSWSIKCASPVASTPGEVHPQVSQRDCSYAATSSIGDRSCEGASSSGRSTSPENATLQMLNGKRVLVVEPNSLVRVVIALALRRWGCLVCAVGSELEAIKKLKGACLNGSIITPFVASGRLELQHCNVVHDLYDCAGPFDVVVTDIDQNNLLHAVLHCHDDEARRVVFMGWPGQQEVEDSPPAASFNPLVARSTSGRAIEMVSHLLNNEVTPRGRQLGYVSITRPVRQGRLKLALEEVLCMKLDSGDKTPLDAHGTNLQRQVPKLTCANPIRRSASGTDVVSTVPRQNVRILLAEDNSINMKVACGILRRLGYETLTTVTDGQQALDVLMARGGANSFDIILMDLHMPLKGGMEVVQEIRVKWPDSPVRVIAVTADAFEDTKDTCLTSGFDGWLPKPFRVNDMVEAIETQCAAAFIFQA